MKSRKIWLLIAVLAFAAAGGCIFYLWKDRKEKEDAAEMYEQMRRQTQQYASETADQTGDDVLPEEESESEAGGKTESENTADAAAESESATEAESETGTESESRSQAGSGSESQAESESETEEPVAIPIDFEALQETNPDIYGWITVPGTVIDYPVVQREGDNSYYLTRSADGQENVNGAIFSEDLNQTDFSDVHTVLYGHNMKDGSMFAELHKYEDEEFFNENREIIVYTQDAAFRYEIFAAYLYDDRHLLRSFDCTDPEVFQVYMESVLNQRNLYAHIDKETEIGEGDRILTLSTCHSKGNDYRYLVQAVLVKKQPALK